MGDGGDHMVRKTVKGEAGRGLGRPRRFDASAALEAARSVFWNLGYAGSSLHLLETACGLSRPSLYAAFGNKHALYMAALEKSRDEALEEMGRLLVTEDPLPALLTALYASASRVYRVGSRGQRGSFLTSTGASESVADTEVRAVMAAFLEATDQVLCNCFSRRSQDLAPGVTPQAAALVAAATLHSMAVRARAGADQGSLGAVASGAISLICGVGPAAPSQGKRS
jgi:AcrR family transcriptional regulator